MGQRPTQCEADTRAPTVPGSLKVTQTTQSAATVSWSASSDNVGVAAYDVVQVSQAGMVWAILPKNMSVSKTEIIQIIKLVKWRFLLNIHGRK